MNYYLDDDLNICEANENRVYRVFGGDSGLDGGYVTPDCPDNPIQARGDLALSQHDFLDDDGEPIRNMASSFGEGTIYTTDDGRIIDPLTNEVTDNFLGFTEVAPTSDLPGGGLEYELQDDFNHVVEIDNVTELRHEPTDGWLAYVEAESEAMESDMDQQVDSPDDWWTADDHVDESLDELIDDEEYDIQKDDVESSFFDEQDWDSDDDSPERDRSDEDWWFADSHEEESVDQLIEDEEFDIQEQDVEQSFEEEDVNTFETSVNETENEY